MDNGFPSLGRLSSGPLHVGLQDGESHYAAASPLVESPAGIPHNEGI